jgi:hypothetical protein
MPSLIYIFFGNGIHDLLAKGRYVKTLTFIKPNTELCKQNKHNLLSAQT